MPTSWTPWTTEERAAFEAHLPGCPDCRGEVASLREAATTMAVADAVAPPPEMRDAVRARIARTPQLPPQVGADAPDEATPPPAATDAGPVRADRRREPPHRLSRCVAAAHGRRGSPRGR